MTARLRRLRRRDTLSKDMTKIVRARISNSTAARLNAAASSSRVDKSALIREGIHHVIRKVEAAGTSIAENIQRKEGT